MSEKKRILLMSDGIWSPTGFACVIKNLIKNLKDEYECAILSWQYVGNVLKYDGITIYPIGSHQFGKDTFEFVANHFKPDILITYGDFWMVNYLGNERFQAVLKKNNTKWLWYCPIDSDIVPIAFESILKVPDELILSSKDGKRVVDALGIKNVYIPHGVNIEEFKPLANRDELRAKEGYTDKFVIGSVARNQDRKQLPRLMEAFSLFAKDKDDVVLHMHCDPFDPANMIPDYNGSSYSVLLQAMHTFKIDKMTNFTKNLSSYINGFNEDGMSLVYNLFDVHGLSTSGEGFGIPIIESEACGIPNVMTDFTTARELVYGRGEVCKVSAKIFGAFGSNRAIVDVSDMAAKFELLYNDRDKLSSYSKDCVEFAKGYDWKVVMKDWRELLDKYVC